MNQTAPKVAFDHHLESHVTQSLSIFRELRESAPVAWTDNHGGFWVVSRYEDVLELSRNPKWFLSGRDGENELGGGVNIPSTPIKLVPTESDGRDWRRYRRVLNPMFTPAALKDMRGKVEDYADALIDRCIESGRIDFVKGMANPLPALLTLNLLGMDMHGWEQYAEPIHVISYAPAGTPESEKAYQGMAWIAGKIREEVAIRRAQPNDGLVSALIAIDDAQPGDTHTGGRLDDEEIFDLIMQLVMGGMDTTTSLLANSFNHLNDDLESRHSLRDDPSKLLFACEELLRLYAPVQSVARTAACDFTLGGMPIKNGDRLLMLWAAANRDEQQFERPDTMDIGRFPNRHLSFGIGSHKCLGSNFARIMFEVAVRKVLQRMPDYRIDTENSRHYPTMSGINGWSALPAQFTPGPRVGAPPLPG